MRHHDRNAASDRKLVQNLWNRLGILARNLELYRQALTDRSSTLNPERNNERLEFLGDGALKFAVHDLLYRYGDDRDRLANAMEAILAAVYLDRGTEALTQFTRRNIMGKTSRLLEQSPKDRQLTRSLGDVNLVTRLTSFLDVKLSDGE